MKINTAVAEVEFSGINAEQWQRSVESVSVEPGVEDIKLQMTAKQAVVPSKVTIQWSVPMLDMGVRWTPIAGFDRNIPPEWFPSVGSNLASSSPMMSFFGYDGTNGMTFAVSEALRQVEITGGICEFDNRIQCRIELFTLPEAPIDSYEIVLRIDARKIFYADAIRGISDWFASMPAYFPSPAPDAAFEPVYSTWYSYHQELFDHELEKECELAASYGMKGIILDDGWQTDDHSGGYAFCGDWEMSRKRFPDMRAHVDKVHGMGLKYLVWFSVPFAGYKSEAAKTFAGKFLYRIDKLSTWVFDPRFPEVREYLIKIYETAVREWGIDGLKLDFIDNFHFEGEDPAIKEDYAGRDIKSVPEAVDVLLSETMRRLRRLNPDIMVEFRQKYIGPAVRKYGNMFRANDCPADALSNRNRIIDLRLASGNTAVHSDMLEWNLEDSAESAALQLLSILFSVPQISVKLAQLPDAHRAMLKFWLQFCRDHQDVLLQSQLTPLHPELNYPVVTAENSNEAVVAVYNPGQFADIRGGKTTWLINATRSGELVAKLGGIPKKTEVFDVCGNTVASPGLTSGLQSIPVPPSGLIKLDF